MTELIHALVAWLRGLLKPRSVAHPVFSEPSGLAALWGPFTPPPHRSPYSLGLDDRIDVSSGPLVRPYLTAYEQRERRRDLLLATFGVDAPGPYWIHGVEVV